MGGPGDATTGTAPGLYLVVDGVAATYDQALAAGARSVYPPEQTEWGTWRTRLTDPDGHEWTVGTYQPGQSW
ncbi:MAG: VOC family protein [Actinomycetota bacterium]